MTDKVNVFQILKENKLGLPIAVRREHWQSNAFFIITEHEAITGEAPYFNNPRVYGNFCYINIRAEERLTVAGSKNWEIWNSDF